MLAFWDLCHTLETVEPAKIFVLRGMVLEVQSAGSDWDILEQEKIGGKVS